MNAKTSSPITAPGRNLPLAIAMMGKATASGPHGDRRTKRNRDRSAQRRNAIRDHA